MGWETVVGDLEATQKNLVKWFGDSNHNVCVLIAGSGINGCSKILAAAAEDPSSLMPTHTTLLTIDVQDLLQEVERTSDRLRLLLLRLTTRAHRAGALAEGERDEIVAQATEVREDAYTEEIFLQHLRLLSIGIASTEATSESVHRAYIVLEHFREAVQIRPSGHFHLILLKLFKDFQDEYLQWRLVVSHPFLDKDAFINWFGEARSDRHKDMVELSGLLNRISTGLAPAPLTERDVTNVFAAENCEDQSTASDVWSQTGGWLEASLIYLRAQRDSTSDDQLTTQLIREFDKRFTDHWFDPAGMPSNSASNTALRALYRRWGVIEEARDRIRDLGEEFTTNLVVDLPMVKGESGSWELAPVVRRVSSKTTWALVDLENVVVQLQQQHGKSLQDARQRARIAILDFADAKDIPRHQVVLFAASRQVAESLYGRRDIQTDGVQVVTAVVAGGNAADHALAGVLGQLTARVGNVTIYVVADDLAFNRGPGYSLLQTDEQQLIFARAWQQWQQGQIDDLERAWRQAGKSGSPVFLSRVLGRP